MIRSLESQCETNIDGSVKRIVGSIVLRIGALDVVEAEQVHATHIELSLVDVACMGEKRFREVVVNLDIAQLEEVAVSEPYRVGVVVILVVL